MCMLKILLKKKNSVLNLNFGPQHPAAHGVLRLLLSLKNEKVVNCDPNIGLLHRGSEYLITTKPFYLSLPYFDRMDYVSMMCQEHTYCLAVEKSLKNFYTPNTLKKNRVVLDEITRILNHLLAIACHALDVGSMSPIFWSFEERENIMEIYENLSGARMHAAYIRPLFGNKLLNKSILEKVIFFSKNLIPSINEINFILVNNKVWRSRLVSIGIVNKNTSLSFGLTGVFQRASGIKNDVRLSKVNHYAYYNNINLNSFVSNNGDSYDRYIIRVLEVLESSNISCTIATQLLLEKSHNLVESFYKHMEGTIKSFKLWSGSTCLSKSSSNAIIESPKGVFGVSIITDSTSKPIRCKIRSPSYNNLFWLKKVSKGLLLADLITLIGTIDIVFGEIDR